MTPEERIRARIAEINQGRRSVQFLDIEWVMNHLRDDLHYRVRRLGENKHYSYLVEDLDAFRVCDHHRGQKHVLLCYVTQFLARMDELGLLD